MFGQKTLSFVSDPNVKGPINFKANGANWQALCAQL